MMKLTVLLVSFLIVFSANSQESDLPILKENPKKGIYKTFEEFKTNQPSITDAFSIERKPREYKVWEGSSTLIPRYKENNRKIKNGWGYCDGHNVYIFHQVDYFPIEIEDNELSFFAYGDFDESRIIVGGILGGPIQAGISTQKVYAVAKNQKRKYIINLSTGEIIGSPEKYDKDNNIIIPSTKVIFYRNGKKELDQAFRFKFEGDIIHSLSSNSVQELLVVISKNPLSICFGEGFSECNTFLIDEDKTYYLECSISKKDKVPSLTEVKEVNGDYYSKKARIAQEKRENKKN